MVPDRPEREGRLHDQLLELESIRSAGLLSAAEHKSKREAVISRWEESLRKREELETTLDENKAKTQQLLHALRATVKHGSDLLSKKQMAGVRQAYLELTGLSSLPSAAGTKLRDLCARCVAENFVPRRGRAGPSGAKRREEDALDNDRETWGSWSLPDQPLDDLEDSGAPTPAPVTPDEVPPAPTEEEEPQEPEEKARRREWEAAKGIAAVAGVRRRAGIVPKRPRRERKAPNPYVPVDFRPEPKCHNHQVEREDRRGFDCQAQSSEGKKKRKFEVPGCARSKGKAALATGGTIVSPAQKKQKKIEPNAKTKVSPRAARANSPRAAPVRREPLPQKRGRGGPKNRWSLYCGVSFNKKTRRWLARVRTKGKLHSLGRYKDEEMAAKVFDKAVIKIRGKDADTNFPPEEYAEEMRLRGPSEVSVEEFIRQLRSEAKRQNKLSSEAKEADGQAKLECVACGTKTTPKWRNIESKAYCNACGLRKMRAMKSLLGPKKKRGRLKKISLPGEKLLAKAKKPAGRKRKRKPDKVVDVEDVVT